MSQPRQTRPTPQQRPAAQQRPATQRTAAPQRPLAQQRPVQAARPATRPAAAPRPRRVSRIPDGYWKFVVGGIVMLLIAIAMQGFWPNGFKVESSGKISRDKAAISVIYGTGPIRLNELMSANPGAIVDENGEAGDWIEVANIGSDAVNLYGYSMAKDAKSANVFYFPDMILEPGECVLVFADSVSREVAGQTLHAPFKLSSQGGSLMLFNRKGNAIDTINFPAMPEGESYARIATADWEITDEPTPGLMNSEESYLLLHEPRTDAGVEIVEVVASNTQHAPDENGVYHDYIILRNTTGNAIDLSGWYLSDDSARPTKWRFPQGYSIAGGANAIVYASGLDRADNARPHTNFKLSTEGEDVVLSDATGRLVDTVTYDLLKRDQGYTKGADGSWSVIEAWE